MEYERQLRQHQESFTALRAARFRPPAVSRAAAARLEKAYYNLPPLGLNEQSEAVKALQKALIDLKHPGIAIPDGATGYYGRQTQAAVMAFQRLAKLSGLDGVAGKETLSRLDEVWAANAANLDKILPPYDDEVVVYCPNQMMIPRLKQPSPTTCWATAGAMVYYWRRPEAMATAQPGIHEFIKNVLRRAQNSERWLKYYPDSGLPPGEEISFYSRGLGMQHAGASPHEDYGIGFWTGKLVRSPILLLSGQVVVQTLEAHAVVLIGLRRFASDNIPKAYVIDPWDGLDKEWTFMELMRRVGWLRDMRGDWRTLIPSTLNQYRERVFYW